MLNLEVMADVERAFDFRCFSQPGSIVIRSAASPSPSFPYRQDT